MKALIGLIILFSLIGSGSLLYFARETPTQAPLQLSQPSPGGDFTLQSAAGPVALTQFRGKFVLIHFGYTFCPDVCPTGLAYMSAMLKKLSAQELDQVQVFFISVDPKRDNLEKLKNYTSFFHPKIMGLTGSESEIRKVADLYGADYKIQPTQEGKDYYTIDHTASIYVVGPDGKLIATISHGTSPDGMLAVLRPKLKNT